MMPALPGCHIPHSAFRIRIPHSAFGSIGPQDAVETVGSVQRQIDGRGGDVQRRDVSAQGSPRGGVEVVLELYAIGVAWDRTPGETHDSGTERDRSQSQWAI